MIKKTINDIDWNIKLSIISIVTYKLNRLNQYVFPTCISDY